MLIFKRILALILIFLPSFGFAQSSSDGLFICRITLTEKIQREGLPKDFFEVIKDHAKYLDDLGKEGKLIFAGRTRIEPPTDKSNYGLALFKVSSLEDIEKIREADPAVKQGYQQWEFLPFSLGIHYLNNLENR
jgi:uncharacterized protein YciI